MIRTLIAIGTILAWSPPCYSRPASDGYAWGKAEFIHKDISIHLVEYASEGDLRRAFPQVPYNTMALSVINPHTNDCTIHIVSPAKSYHPELVGHEVLHCFYGNWHLADDQIRSLQP